MLIETKCKCGNKIKTDTLQSQKFGAENSNLILFIDQEVNVFCVECGNVITLDNGAKETVEVKAERIACIEDYGLNDTHEAIQMHGYEAVENDDSGCLKDKLRNFLNSYNKCVEDYGVKAVLEFIENDIQANY